MVGSSGSYGEVRVAVVLRVERWVEHLAEVHVESATHDENPDGEHEHRLWHIEEHRVALHLQTLRATL